MKKHYILSGLMVFLVFPMFGQFIQEIDYDQPGTDNAEFIEVFLPAGSAAPGDYTVTLYNGSGSSAYFSFDLDASTVTCIALNGGQLCTWDPAGSNNLQNGAPDGVALAGPSGLIEFLSYEGDFTASGGIADGVTSTDIGVAEGNGSPNVSLQRTVDGDWFVAAPGIGIFPVDLISFSAATTANEVALTFSTASESNNSHFDIERSTDGRTFQQIGRVAGKGTTTEQVDYEFIDKKPAQGWNYYRLKQVDYDGTSEYFGPIRVYFGEDKLEDKVKVFPTLVNDQFTLEVSDELPTDLQLSILNTNGQVLRQWNVREKALRTPVSVSELPAGTYWLRWQDGQQQGTSRFIKL